MAITLDNMQKGQKGKILKIVDKGPFNRRIRDMGVVPGTEILYEGKAPLGDPINIKAKGFSIALRNNEAEKILVEII